MTLIVSIALNTSETLGGATPPQHYLASRLWQQNVKKLQDQGINEVN